MKTLLGLIVLFLSAYLYSTEIISACYTENHYEETKTKLMPPPANPRSIMNKYRAEMAGIHRIANMHELKYDYELEKEARKMKTCADIKHGSNYRVEKYNWDEGAAVWSEFLKTSANQSQTRYSMDLEPLLTAFVHCNLTAKCRFPFHENNKSYIYEEYTVSIYGYRGTFSVSDFQHGPPGSKCTHGKTGQGLCIAPPRSEMETSATGSGQGSNETNIGVVNSMISCFIIALIAVSINLE